ncbi:MAG: putative DNA binding domain-containing protein [Coleofasciculus sp. G3-WIS-01]|uniref:AlbA family DNA-binding domain-containing protein n=1 Tax=Coleofasciculus sp. G3-WIS-01 TaxID=3069528 RepID=UPI0033049792
MNDQELATLLNDLESDRVERKALISDRNIIRQAICAFANDLPNHQQPGVLFIGVNNDGTCENLPITDQLLLILSDMRSDGNILPFPEIIVQKRTISGCELVVVIVKPSDAPPVRFNGRVWVRVGPRRATATRQEERRLAEKRRAKDLPFDILPLPSASLDDLDLDLFRRVYLPSSLAIDILEENERSIEQQLTSMRFATVEPQPKPTVLGVLVVGSDPRQFIPGAYIQFLRIDGSELTIGYVVLQHSARLDRPVKAYNRWIARIPTVYHEDVLNQPLTHNISVVDDPNCLALLKNYQSLMPMAQEARKPIFYLKPADGAIGAHTSAVRNVYREFEKLARAIAQRTGVKQLPTPTVP